MSLDFHVLSFEGPDDYSRAGGIASRITSLSRALVRAGFETHLWFVGDPGLPGHEDDDGLHLHRWCQWISRYHPAGVYDGEDGKRRDYCASLPLFLLERFLAPRLTNPSRVAVVLAEEWQTADAVLLLDERLRRVGLRDRVALFWNANNTFGFDRVDWPRLARAATITTVSRFMRQKMWERGVDPLVIPNGLPVEALRGPDRGALEVFRHAMRGRITLCKVARWDPDKRWLLAVDTVAALKREGHSPLLVARGGVEAHGAEVLARARDHGLRVVELAVPPGEPGRLARSVRALGDADIVSLRTRLHPECSRLLFRACTAVLANSGSEPFGLVGLEAMAAGGIVCVGGTGEDYAVSGWNAFVLQTLDPTELSGVLHRLGDSPEEERAVRRRARVTARRYAWPEIIRRDLLPRVDVAWRRIAAVPTVG